MASRTPLFRHAPSFIVSRGSWLAGFAVSVGADPYWRSCSQTSSPDSVYTVTAAAPSPTMTRRPASEGSVE